MTSVAAWLAAAPRTRLRLLTAVIAEPDCIPMIARRITSARYAAYYRRQLYALRDRGLIYERSDGLVVATAAGRNALSKAKRLLVEP